jgi:hypothetical protein
VIQEEDFKQDSRFQNVVPEKEVILSRLAKPFLLDFKRNQILNIDYINGGPPPGIPFFKGSDALAEYLRSKGIKYVSYSYSDEGGFSKNQFKYRLDPVKDRMERMQARFLFDFQDNLMQLSRTKKRIYDDGNIFVLDLVS